MFTLHKHCKKDILLASFNPSNRYKRGKHKIHGEHKILEEII